jgi:hypothetical protein
LAGTDAEKFENLRVRLDGALRPQGLPNRVWTWLQKTGLAQDVVTGARSFDVVAAAARSYIDDSVRTARELGYTKNGGRLDMVDFGPDRRLEVLSEVASLWASDLLFVGIDSFRADHLDGRLLQCDEVEPWLWKTARAEGQPEAASEYITVPVPHDAAHDLHLILLRRLREPRDASAYSQWLHAFADGLEATKEGPAPKTSGPLRVLGVPARRDGILALLQRLAEDCAHSLSWTVDQAVRFVLCGTHPPLSKMRVSRRTYAAFPALDRLEIVVDPRVRPRELASLYAKALRQLGFPGGSDKPMTEKNLLLAAFVQRHRSAILSGQTTWPKLRDEWNEDHPNFAHTKADPSARQFATECRTAWKRLTGDDWQRRQGASAPQLDQGGTS